MTRAGVTMKFLKDVDMRAFDALKKRIEGDGRVVNVGIPTSAKEEDGTPVAMIAAVQEFGSPERGIPERSFLRSGVKVHGNDFVQLNRRNLAAVLNGTMTFDTALGQLGAFAAGKVKQQIKDATFAPLKQETIDRKGSTKPLIDTGQMWQSITYELGNRK